MKNKNQARYSVATLPFLVIFSIFIAACQTTPENPEETALYRELQALLGAINLQIGNRFTDLREPQITDWGYLNDQALVLTVEPDRYALITLNNPCRDLDLARHISFEPRTSYVVPVLTTLGGLHREGFTDYLGRGDRLLLGRTREEIFEIQAQRTGPAGLQLGTCFVDQIFHLQPTETMETNPEGS